MSRYELDADYVAMKNGHRIPLDDDITCTVMIDLNGASLTQPIIDEIVSAAGCQGSMVNIIIRRMGTIGGVPRLIADRGEIYDALTKLLKERNTKQLDS